MSQKILFIDRDGTLINEVPPTYQVDSFDKLTFYPNMFEFMNKIASECNYELVMISNQDGLGTASFPEDTFWPVQNFVMKSMENENIHFNAVHFDRTFPEEHAPTRKPGIGMLTSYLNNASYDIANSFVIGDRITDMELAKNLGCKGIWLKNHPSLGANEITDTDALQNVIVLETRAWKDIYEFLRMPERKIRHQRNTNETKIDIELNLDGKGEAIIKTGLSFFDHMLEQIAKHGNVDLRIHCEGDLQVDEHHTIEDTAITLGEAILKALGDKLGIERYGFLLPMDDCLAQVALDFGGRSRLVWEVEFKREKIGDMPTEMFYHFFKSFSDAAKCNLNIKAEGTNEHHKIESIFKAFAKTIKMAVKRDGNNNSLPSTKGIL
ncbi:MAG TPA: bifunctional histidinol-phosphatase/imidazoleglycerol-phosphate dehydratase HisB [Chitinophagaceae bacterium]|nr:bifunctional histidinol-phosphatase/imidazoleglycerol-phosphate dehydratase HisB [Chitinophagaceae bacterium]